MIRARKNKLMEWGFTRFNRLFLQHHFEDIYLWNHNRFPPNKKTLFLINHSTWWDPLLIFYLNNQVIQSDGYAMMHEDGLHRHPFFKTIGGYSINSSDRRHLMESLHYSVELLNQDKTVWIFPQGEEQHLEKRPLQFFSGPAFIADRCSDVQIVPISLYYSLEHTKKPNAYIRIGPVIDRDSYKFMNRKEKMKHFEEVATLQLDELRASIVEEDSNAFISIKDHHS